MSRKAKGTVPLLMHFGEVVEAAKAIYEKGGGVLAMHALADTLENSPSSSTFSKKLGCLRQHGLAEERAGQVHLTPLGLSIVAPPPEDGGRSFKEAFLRIPVYQLLFNRYAGKTLPAARDLANVLVHERTFPKELAEKWAELFYEGAKAARLIVGAAGKTVLLEAPERKSEVPTASVESMRATLTPVMQSPVVAVASHRSDLVVLHVPFGDDRFAEVRFTPGLSADDFDVVINMLNAYKGRGKSKRD